MSADTPGGATINSDDEGVGQVAAALADAKLSGGLSTAYHREADDALRRLWHRVHRAEAALCVHLDCTPEDLADRDRRVEDVDAARLKAPDGATHDLKTWPVFFDAVKCGDKTFDVRRDDRGYRCGDLLVLRKWNPDHERYLTEEGWETDVAACAETVRARVTYVLAGLGIEAGHVCMGISIEASPS